MAIRWNNTFADGRWDIEADYATEELPIVDAFGERLKGGSTCFICETQELKTFEYSTTTWIPQN